MENIFLFIRFDERKNYIYLKTFKNMELFL